MLGRGTRGPTEACHLPTDVGGVAALSRSDAREVVGYAKAPQSARGREALEYLYVPSKALEARNGVGGACEMPVGTGRGRVGDQPPSRSIVLRYPLASSTKVPLRTSPATGVSYGLAVPVPGWWTGPVALTAIGS